MLATTLVSHPLVWGTSLLEWLAVLTIVPTAGAVLRHLTCHQPGCFRLGRFPYRHFKLCHRHHPEIKGRLTADHINTKEKP